MSLSHVFGAPKASGILSMEYLKVKGINPVLMSDFLKCSQWQSMIYKHTD